jgi:hypothetical protein
MVVRPGKRISGTSGFISFLKHLYKTICLSAHSSRDLGFQKCLKLLRHQFLSFIVELFEFIQTQTIDIGDKMLCHIIVLLSVRHFAEPLFEVSIGFFFVFSTIKKLEISQTIVVV